MTILLWGNAWWLPGGGSRSFPSLGEAPAALAEYLAESPKPVRIRLIYAPDAFESVATPCPLGNRPQLAAALSPEFPTLEAEGHAWSHEPVLTLHDGHSTIVHYEREPALFQLGRELAVLGLALESAWPLSTFLSALPEEWSISGAVTVVAIAGDRALGHHHPTTGGPAVKRWTGDDVEGQVSAWLGAPGTRDPNGLVLVLRPRVETETPFAGYDRLSLGDALGRSVTFPRNHPAQLLPPASRVSAPMLAVAASGLLLLSACFFGWRYVEAGQAQERAFAANAAAKGQLKTEIARATANEPQVRLLRAALAGPGGSPPVTELLEQVGRTIPRELTLGRVAVEGARFRVEGFAAPGAAPDLVARWQAEMKATTWAFDGPPVLRAPGEFAVLGTFAR